MSLRTKDEELEVTIRTKMFTRLNLLTHYKSLRWHGISDVIMFFKK